MSNPTIKFVFFGGEPLGVPTLEELKATKLLPSLIVCNPDRPAGRGQRLQAPPVKIWAEEHKIPVWQPESLKDIAEAAPLTETNWDVFVVVAYNKILPQWLIELPAHNTVNVHPSLLPKLRGASPIRSAILRNEPHHVGVSIMQMDAEMDHGPLLAQQRMDIAPEHWPIAGPELDEALARHGGALLAATLPEYIAGDLVPQEQKHEHATHCGRLDKTMAELTIDPYDLPVGDAAYAAFRTIQAFAGIGDAWFMHDDIRYKIKTAHLEDEQLVINTVVPSGKQEVSFVNYFGI